MDFDSLTRPTAAFITFEEEDACILALKLETEQTLLGQPIKFKSASEPTDIIWENRIFTSSDYLKRKVKAYTIIAILLAVSFYFIYRVARTSSIMSRTFPRV